VTTQPIRQAIVLTAGLGTRLQPLTRIRAKPAIPVAGEPMVRRIARWLGAEGVTDLVLNLHHLPETLTAVVGDGADLGVRARYSWEPHILGSAGGPRLAGPLLPHPSEPFFIVNGDTLTDVSLAAVAAAHASSGARVTLALVPNREFLRYGGVAVDAEGRVIGFPRRGPEAEGSGHFIGVQIADASVFASVRHGDVASSIGGVYDALIAAQPDAVRGIMSSATFWDVGTVDDYRRTCSAFAEREHTADLGVGRGAQIDPSARIVRSILWDDVRVGANAIVEDCILTDGVNVPAGAEYRQTILLAHDLRS
jgi:NDP-sugar pyrophosphorylase family protein